MWDCGFFEWHDPLVSERVKNLLNELKYDIVMLMAENKQLKALRNSVGSSMEDDLNWYGES